MIISLLADLAQNRFFEDPAFVKYLQYLQYWKRPEYAKFIVYPHCLHFLDLLQDEQFRKAVASTQNKVRFCPPLKNLLTV